MKKQRKLFCEISPLTYAISEKKCILVRKMKNLLTARHFAKTKSEEPLPFCIYKHNSLIRRRLGNVDMQLQENKAVNLGIAAPKLNKILIRPGETFSFWHLVGNTTENEARAGFNNDIFGNSDVDAAEESEGFDDGVFGEFSMSEIEFCATKHGN